MRTIEYVALSIAAMGMAWFISTTAAEKISTSLIASAAMIEASHAP